MHCCLILNYLPGIFSVLHASKYAGNYATGHICPDNQHLFFLSSFSLVPKRRLIAPHSKNNMAAANIKQRIKLKIILILRRFDKGFGKQTKVALLMSFTKLPCSCYSWTGKHQCGPVYDYLFVWIDHFAMTNYQRYLVIFPAGKRHNLLTCASAISGQFRKYSCAANVFNELYERIFLTGNYECFLHPVSYPDYEKEGSC